MNSAVIVFPVAPLSGGIPTYLCYSAIYLVCSVLLYVRFGPRPLWPATRRRAGRCGRRPLTHRREQSGQGPWAT